MNEKSKYTNLEPNIAGALAYIVSPLTGIAFLFIEKENKFVKFHAIQSILFGVASFVAYMIASALIYIIIGLILVPIISVVVFLGWVFLMYKAYSNEMYELPFLGKIAKEQSEK